MVNSSVSLQYIPISEQLEVDESVVVWAGSLLHLFIYVSLAVFCPTASILGCRFVCVLGCILTVSGYGSLFLVTSFPILCFCFSVIGIGTGMILASSYVILGACFVQKYSCAVSVSLGSATVGMVCGGPSYMYLFTMFGLHGAYLLNAGICAQCFVGGSLYGFAKPNALSCQEKPQTMKLCWTSLKAYLSRNLWNNASFYFLNTATLFFHLGFFIFLLFFSIWVVSRDQSFQEASILVLISHSSNAVGRFSMSICNFSANQLLVIFISASFLFGTCLLTIPICWTFSVYSVMTAILGCCTGINVCAMFLLIQDTFDMQSKNACLGLNYFIVGFASFIASPITESASKLTDLDGLQFFIAGICSIFSGLVMVLLLYKNKILIAYLLWQTPSLLI